MGIRTYLEHGCRLDVEAVVKALPTLTALRRRLQEEYDTALEAQAADSDPALRAAAEEIATSLRAGVRELGEAIEALRKLPLVCDQVASARDRLLDQARTVRGSPA